MSKQKKIWIGIAVTVIAVALVTAGFLLHRERKQQLLEEKRNEAVLELERNAGQYDEQSIVLYETSKAKAEELAELYGAELRITENGRFATLKLPEGTTILDVYAMDESLKYIDEMAADYQVKISELEDEEEENGERLPMRPQYSVLDTDYELQTYLDYLNMGSVWNNYKGNGITVAVIDTGIDTDHPELAGRISEYSYNATEDKIVKDWNYDWSLIEDEQGHGTAVTGVIAASMNGSGIVGIAPNVNILVIKAECDENGKFARTSDLVFGLYYAIERDVQVVNMSFGISSPVNPFAEAVQLAYDSDIVCVAAAGNDGTSALCWPAADEKVIGVGALGEGWKLADYSNYGENINLVAPGSTYTCAMGGGYATTQGTSLASPIVAGAIALYMQTDKYTTFDRVTDILYASCYDLGDLGRDWYYGFGALDISAFILEQRGKIIYDMLTDELENEEGVYIQGHALQELPEPERLYAVFDGWYYDDTFTQEYNYYADKFYGEEITLYAKWANEDDGVPYTYVILDDGTVEIRSYTGHRRYITIPEKIDGRIVSSIGDFAFSGQTRLREVTLPSGLRHIGLNAFEYCSNLVTIQIPANVIEIEEKAFKDNVRLATIAFLENSKLESIGDFAFQNCGKLERIELPASLESINGSAFYGATALNSITVQIGNSQFMSKDGVLFNLTGSTLVAYPAAHGSSYALPGQTMGIGAYAFGFAGLKEIQLTNVESIGESAFAYAALETLTLPDSVTNMAEGAFAYNTKLAKVTIGRGLTQISPEAFTRTTALQTITIPNGITLIGGAAFSSSGLTSVVFEENSNLILIRQSAFSGCNISEIDIPASVLEIGEGAFERNPLIRVGFADNAVLHTIGEGAFVTCWLLENIDLPTSLRTIGGFAFQSSGLTEATIPAGVTTIGEGAFSLCSNLTKVEVEAGNTVYHDIDGVVYTLDNTAIHTYPAGKAGENYTLQNTTQVVAPWAFAGAVNLTTVTLPESLTQISEYGFAYCGKLSNIHIPDNVLQIGRYAFANDWNLYSITFNETAKLPRISFGSFAYCGLTYFRLPANVSTMAQGAFMGCKNLTSFTFAANSKLESISAYMFDGCTNLRTITFEQGSALTSIQAHGLEGMDKLTAINFGDAKLTNVDNFAFRFCESLSVLNLPETVTNIGRYAFYGCKSLAELTIPKNVEHIGSYAFLATKNIDLYFVNETLPAYLDENWDHGTKGYYTGVTSVKEEGNWKYAILESGSIAILKYNGEEAHIDLTKLNLGAPVTIIGGSAFEDSSVQTVVLPDTLTAIQAEAFAYSDLTAIAIPAGVTFIGREAFAYTDITALTFAAGSKLSVMEQYAFAGTKQLTAVILPKSLKTMCTGVFAESGLQSVVFEQGIQITEIPQKAFANTKLTAIALPDGVTLVNHNAFNNVQTLQNVTFGKNEGIRLMSNAFYHTGLTSLHIPANVTYIGEYCFVALPNLQSFSVDENNPNYKAVDGLLLNKSGRKLIAVPAGRAGSLTVPEGVEEIGFGAFEESKLREIKFLPDANILTFGYRAFFKAENITSIAIPKSVVSIDYYAFAYCDNLQTVTFAEDNQLKGIYEGAFLGCIKLENITIPDAIVEISDFAFYGCCKIDQLPISENSQLLGIYDYAFAYTGLKGEFTTPESLWDIGNYAFLGCNFTKVTIPDTNKKILIIGIGAFEDCNKLEEITLPFIGASYENEEISWFGYIFGAGAYEANEAYVPESLKTVTITEGITNIYIGGFAYCTGLETIHVPHSVSVLWNDAFKNTTAIYELANTMTTYWYSTWPLQISCSALGGHFGAGLSESLILSNDVTSIGAYAFYGCSSLTSITIPNSVTNIGPDAFSGCSSLKNITIPDSVTSIGHYVFSGCSSLTSITIPDSVISIGSYAFFDCNNLRRVINKSQLSLQFFSTNHGYIAYYAEVLEDVEGNQTYKDSTYFETEEHFLFSFSYGQYVLHGYLGNEETVTLPSDINGNSYAIREFRGAKHVIIPDGVTSIDGNAFWGCSSLTSITIPDSVTNIGLGAFFNCSSLTSITIPDSVTGIGADAFSGCTSLASITIPDSVTSIDAYAFQNCSSLTNITIPTSVTSIDWYTFQGCTSLTDVTIPNGVTSIGVDAFNGCTSLASITIPDSVIDIGLNAFGGCTDLQEVVLSENANFVFSDGILYNKSVTYIVWISPQISGHVTILDGVTSIDWNAFEGCTSLTSVTIPDSVTDILSYAFRNCTSLTSITIPDSVTTIYEDVFYGCSNLVSITIPDSVTFIGSSAFEGCTSLTDIIIPDSVTNIGSSTFEGCTSLTDIIIPDSVTNIGSNAFKGCTGLTDIVIPNSVTSIGFHAFDGCTNLTSITIPDRVTSIAAYAFQNCSSLTNITIPDSVTNIGSSAFKGCISLTSITIPDSVTSIDRYAFMSCTSLTSITIPDSVTSIAAYAFQNCSSLTNVTIPDSVTSIGDGAFYLCGNLVKVVNNSDLELTLGNNNYGCVAYVLIDKNGNRTYLDDTWFETEDHFLYTCIGGVYTLRAYAGEEINITLPETIEGNSYAICEFRGGKEVTIPNSVTYIGDYAFSECRSLMSIVIPDSVTSIGSYAFHSCSRLSNVTIGNGVTSIGNLAFSGCSSLMSIVIPDSVTSIGDFAFGHCSRLSNVTIGNGMTSIGNSAFWGCSITSITIPDSVTSIGSYAFESCSRLSNVTIGNGVTSIGNSAFSGCGSLMSIVIPDSVTWIGDSAFNGCTSLYSNPNYYQNGMLAIDGWLVDVDDNLRYLSQVGQIRGVVGGAYDGCYLLKNAIWSKDAAHLTNVETLYIASINRQTPYLQNMLTLKNVVICDSVNASDLRYCQELFTYCNVTGVTIWMEALDADLRWDYNFPGWNNGNVVVYGDKWNHVNFYDAEGNLLSTEPKRNSEIIRRPVVEVPEDTEVYTYKFFGWDLDGDGEVDSLPATTAVDIHATAIVEAIHAHSFGDWYVHEVPGCETPGQERRECLLCGDAETQALVPVGHHYDTVVTEPTCTAGGYTTHTCANCGDSYVDSYTDPLPYVPGDTNNDGFVDGNDAIHLLYYTLFGDALYPLNQPADFDGNGVVDGNDAIYLLYYTLFGETVYPLH